jgi:hypothetical protein
MGGSGPGDPSVPPDGRLGLMGASIGAGPLARDIIGDFTPDDFDVESDGGAESGGGEERWGGGTEVGIAHVVH